MTTGEQILALRARWVQDDAELAVRKEANRLRKMQALREKILAGECRTWHVSNCDQCLRALLELNSAAVCEDGKQRELWWK